MKNMSVHALTLLLATNVFAAEGDADTLAGTVFSLLYIVIGLAVFSFVCVALVELAEAVQKLWKNSTTVGRLVIFGIPLSAVSTGIFYVIFYYLFPAMAGFYPFIVNDIYPFLVNHPVGNIIVGAVLECIFYVVGWDVNGKRPGRFAMISRFIVLLPFMPVIYGLYYTVQLFKKACLKDAVIDLNPHIVR